MKKDSDAYSYGQELGRGIKEGMKGINTMASPKKKSVCVKLSLIPFVAVILAIIGGVSQSNVLIGLCLIPCLLSGACHFYVGNFKKGIIYTFTIGGFLIGAIIDLFRLKITNTFRDSNGFPVIYN